MGECNEIRDGGSDLNSEIHFGSNFEDEVDWGDETVQECSEHSIHDGSAALPSVEQPDTKGVDELLLETSAEDSLHHQAPTQEHVSRHLVGQEARPNPVDMGTLVSQASVRLPAALPSLPWETGCMRFIFGDFELPTFTLDAPMPDSASASSASASVPLPEIPNREDPTFRPFEFKKSKDLDYHEARERQREHAIDKWLIVLRRVCAGKAEFHDRDTVRALLGTRAPSTACKRANACLRLLRWADSVGSSKVLEEAVIWRYLKSLEEGDGSGQGDEVLSSLRFMCHVLGVNEAGGLVSRRCVGLAEVMTSRKTFLSQADPLTMQEVRILHGLLTDGNLDAADRAMTAFCIVSIYGRCRVSDTACIRRAQWDTDHEGRGYLVLWTSVHKASRVHRRKAQLMPIIVPLTGVDGAPFGNQVWEALSNVGIQLENRADAPLMSPPDPGGSGKPLRRPLDTDEVTAFLQHCLFRSGASELRGRKITSHSMKRTLLSVASKFGMSREDRSSLGHHADVVAGADAVYAFDLAIGPVQRLEGALSQVARNSFDPDAPRSRYWAFPPEPSVVQVMPPQADAQPIDFPGEEDHDTNAPCSGPAVHAKSEVSEHHSSSESDSSDSGTSEGSSSEDAAPQVKRLKVASMPPVSVSNDRRWVRHAKSGMLHLCYGERTLQCGRTRGAVYVDATEVDMGNPICQSCRRHV